MIKDFQVLIALIFHHPTFNLDFCIFCLLKSGTTNQGFSGQWRTLFGPYAFDVGILIFDTSTYYKVTWNLESYSAVTEQKVG